MPYVWVSLAPGVGIEIVVAGREVCHCLRPPQLQNGHVMRTRSFNLLLVVAPLLHLLSQRQLLSG